MNTPEEKIAARDQQIAEQICGIEHLKNEVEQLRKQLDEARENLMREYTVASVTRLRDRFRYLHNEESIRHAEAVAANHIEAAQECAVSRSCYLEAAQECNRKLDQLNP